MTDILIGQSNGRTEQILLRYANRHGLITGATGTGKTVTLQTLAEGFSRAGVPVFAADMKGDLSGVAAPGDGPNGERFPVTFWDLFGVQGHPIRTTVHGMGSLLMSRILELSPTQEGVLNVAMEYASYQGRPMATLEDLKAALRAASQDAKLLSQTYGYVSSSTVGTILRQILVQEKQGAAKFFGLPSLNLQDMFAHDNRGYGMINLLAADQLMSSPKVYAAFMVWLMSELFKQLPEVGDKPKPQMVFFFDEAHLLFNDAPKAMIDQIERTVRLIRSKGVGIYFVTQSPGDIPDKILGQLGNRIQHTLRAYTPRDQKAVRVAAETFRQNPQVDTQDAIQQLRTGEALVSTIQEDGTPSQVHVTKIAFPHGRVGPLTAVERQRKIRASHLYGIYDEADLPKIQIVDTRSKWTAAPTPDMWASLFLGMIIMWLIKWWLG